MARDRAAGSSELPSIQQDAIKLHGMLCCAEALLWGLVCRSEQQRAAGQACSMHVQMAEIASMGPRSNGITIRDAADRAAEVAEPQPELALDSGAEADLDFARQLQAKLDAQEARGGAGARSAPPHAASTTPSAVPCTLRSSCVSCLIPRNVLTLDNCLGCEGRLLAARQNCLRLIGIVSVHLILARMSTDKLCLLCRRPSGKGAAYIKISESEIANDYPEPAPYQKVPCNICHTVLCIEALFLHAMLTASSYPLGSRHMRRRPSKRHPQAGRAGGQASAARQKGCWLVLLAPCCSLPI